MKSSKTIKPRLYPVFRVTPKTKDLPATQQMLHLVRNELVSRIKESQFDLRSEFSGLKSEFSGLRSEFSGLRSDFEKVLKAVHHMSAEVFRIGVLVEEQNSRNRIVLEGHTGLAQRQDRLEARVDEVERTMRSIARSRS